MIVGRAATVGDERVLVLDGGVEGEQNLARIDADWGHDGHLQRF